MLSICYAFNLLPIISPGFYLLVLFHLSKPDDFKGCLSDIRAWSQRNPNHLPIIITINPKSSGTDLPGFTPVIPFDKKVLDSLDQEIWDIFDKDMLITPALVKGKKKTLRKAILKKGWPDLSNMRGKILFVFDSPTELTGQYLEGDDAYQRPMFANTGLEHSHAAFFIMNDPIKQETEIADRVKKNSISCK